MLAGECAAELTLGQPPAAERPAIEQDPGRQHHARKVGPLAVPRAGQRSQRHRAGQQLNPTQTRRPYSSRDDPQSRPSPTSASTAGGATIPAAYVTLTASAEHNDATAPVST